MKIYTGSGDKGKTSLFSGERVSKNDRRIEAIGDLDELNSVIGFLSGSLDPTEIDRISELDQIQDVLFRIGAWLAVTRESPESQQIEALTEERSRFLEDAIDGMTENLPRLTAFILPGGHPTAGIAHMARTISRRTERRVVGLSEAIRSGKPPKILGGTLIFLNRLSDYFFTLARWCNVIHGRPDKEWKK